MFHACEFYKFVSILIQQCHSQPDYALNISEDNMCHHALMTSRFFYRCGGLVWCFGDCVVCMFVCLCAYV